jgi:membrane protein
LPGTYSTVMSPAHHNDADDSPVARAKGMVLRVDRAQQSWPWLAVVVATVRKFSDDKAGLLAALIAYYAFASIFPLLLVAVTILDIVASHFPKVGRKLLAALHDYPVIGKQLHSSMAHGLSGAGLALIIGILLTLFGARGVATALQNALNSVWEVPRFRRPRFPKNLLRSLGLIAVLGPGQIITIALSSVAGGTGHLGGALAKIAAVAVSLLLNVGLFWVTFRLATAAEVATRELRLSAILSAIAWQLLQLLGGFFIAHFSKTTSAYGTFAVVLGLLAWFYLQAQITLYVAEFNVVLVRRLWPRSVAPPPLTAADLAAYQLYAESTLQRPEIDVMVRPVPRAEPGGSGPAAE